MNSRYRKFICIPALALALAACGGQSGNTANQTGEGGKPPRDDGPVRER